MFTGGMAEKEKSRIELKNMSSSTFSALLSFIYTGKLLDDHIKIRFCLS